MAGGSCCHEIRFVRAEVSHRAHCADGPTWRSRGSRHLQEITDLWPGKSAVGTHLRSKLGGHPSHECWLEGRARAHPIKPGFYARQSPVLPEKLHRQCGEPV